MKDDAPARLCDADGCASRQVVGEGDEPDGYSEKPHSAQHGQLEGTVDDGPSEEGGERSKEHCPYERGLRKVADGGNGGISRDRGEQRASLVVERDGEEAEQQIGDEYRGHNGAEEHKRQ